MCLSQTDAAVYQEWIVGSSGIGSYGLSGTGGEGVIVTDYETVEIIILAKLAMRFPFSRLSLLNRFFILYSLYLCFYGFFLSLTLVFSDLEINR